MTNALVNHGKMWTANDLNLPKELARNNTPTELIWPRMGRTEWAVRGKAHAINLSLKRNISSSGAKGK